MNCVKSKETPVGDIYLLGLSKRIFAKLLYRNSQSCFCWVLVCVSYLGSTNHDQRTKVSEVFFAIPIQASHRCLRPLAFFLGFLLRFLSTSVTQKQVQGFCVCIALVLVFAFPEMGSGDKSLRNFHIHLPHLHLHLHHHHHHHGGKKQVIRNVPKGCLAIKVGQGEEQQRFVVPVIYFNHPLFMQLLKEAEEEYGFDQKGTITIPCHVEEFRYVQGMIDREKSLHHHHHVGCFRV